MIRNLVILSAILFHSVGLAGTNALYSDALSWTGKVYIAIIGDSLVAGDGVDNYSAMATTLSNASSGKLSITNASVSGSRWTNMAAQLSGVLTQSPRWVYIHCGRNDLLQCFPSQGYPCYWPTIADCMDAALTNCQNAGARLLVGEILPAYTNYMEFSIPSVHGYNANYATWCLTNKSKITFMSIQHDAFGWAGTNSSGFDNLNPIYASGDELHINQAAYDMWGPLIVKNLAGFFLNTSIGTLTVTGSCVFQ